MRPPAQTAGVQGIAAAPLTMNEPPKSTAVDWRRVVALPPFQMFAFERAYLSQGEIEMLTGFQGPNAMRVMQNLVFRSGNDINALYDDYCQWHADKGYWKNETPIGEVRDA